MIVTSIRQCKQKMSITGWMLFCENKIKEGESNPACWDNGQEVCLDKLEVIQYGYNNNDIDVNHKVLMSYTPENDIKFNVQIVDVTSNQELFELSMRINTLVQYLK